jgi:hypothetical protein
MGAIFQIPVNAIAPFAVAAINGKNMCRSAADYSTFCAKDMPGENGDDKIYN